MDGVVVFRGVGLLGETADELVSSLLVSLVESGTEGVAARINVEVVGEGWVREVHGDFVAHGLLHDGEGSKFAVTPRPGDGGLQQLRHGGGNVREVFDEALIKTTNAKEGSDVFGALGCGPVGDCLDLLWLFFDASRGDNKTAEVDARHREKAFGPFGEESFGAKLVEDQGEVALMVGFVRGVDDYIVDVDGAEGRELLEQEVHRPLKRCGGVAEAKGMTRNWNDP